MMAYLIFGPSLLLLIGAVWWSFLQRRHERVRTHFDRTARLAARKMMEGQKRIEDGGSFTRDEFNQLRAIEHMSDVIYEKFDEAREAGAFNYDVLRGQKRVGDDEIFDLEGLPFKLTAGQIRGWIQHESDLVKEVAQRFAAAIFFAGFAYTWFSALRLGWFLTKIVVSVYKERQEEKLSSFFTDEVLHLVLPGSHPK